MKPAEECGTSINESKSDLVKENGIYVKELKFLGYKLVSDWLQAWSKKGARMKLPRADVSKLENVSYSTASKETNLRSLSQVQLAKRYKMLGFLLSHGWANGNIEKSINRILKIEKKSFLDVVWDSERTSLLSRIVYLELSNASSAASELLLKNWNKKEKYKKGGNLLRMLW